MEDSPLARLPRELRDHIWIATLARKEGISFGYPRTRRLATEQLMSTLLSLTLTCKQICHEARPLLLVANDINAELPDPTRASTRNSKRDRAEYLSHLSLALNRIPSHVRSPSTRLVLRWFLHMPRDEAPTTEAIAWPGSSVIKTFIGSIEAHGLDLLFHFRVDYHRFAHLSAGSICPVAQPKDWKCARLDFWLRPRQLKTANEHIAARVDRQIAILAMHSEDHRYCPIKAERRNIRHGLEKAVVMAGMIVAHFEGITGIAA